MNSLHTLSPTDGLDLKDLVQTAVVMKPILTARIWDA